MLAAEMRGRARTTWVEPAIRSMLQSNGPAAGILRAHGARACTDVTGFGVVGHLVEMMEAAPPRSAEADGTVEENGASATSDMKEVRCCSKDACMLTFVIVVLIGRRLGWGLTRRAVVPMGIFGAHGERCRRFWNGC